MRKALAVLVLGILFVSAMGPGEGQVGEEGGLILKETRITFTDEMEGNPLIYGNKILWRSTEELILFDIAGNESEQLGFRSYFYDLNGDNIVWRGYIPERQNGALALYNIKQKSFHQILGADWYLGVPKVNSDIVIWTGTKNLEEKPDIFGYNIINQTIFPICTHNSSKLNPYIWGDWVVWNDFRNGDSDIYGYNVITGEEIIVSQGPGYQRLEFLWGDRLIWGDANGAFIYNLSSKTQEELPNYVYWAMWNDYIVCGNSNGTYIYEISDENAFLLSKEIYGDYKIWENRIVYHERGDIYLLEFSFPQPSQPSFWEQNRMPIGLGITSIIIAIILVFLFRGKKARNRKGNNK